MRKGLTKGTPDKGREWRTSEPFVTKICKQLKVSLETMTFLSIPVLCPYLFVFKIVTFDDLSFSTTRGIYVWTWTKNFVLLFIKTRTEEDKIWNRWINFLYLNFLFKFTIIIHLFSLINYLFWTFVKSLSYFSLFKVIVSVKWSLIY